MTSQYKSNLEKKTDDILDKMFGDKDPQLRMIMKKVMMNRELTSEMVDLVDQLNKENRTEAQIYEEELVCTLDASGNVVPIQSEEPPYRLPVGKI